MLAWEIFVYRAVSNRAEACDWFPGRQLLASWMVACSGLDWIDELVAEGKAVRVSNNGYPNSYRAAASEILPRILAGLPRPSGPIVIGDDYVLPGDWIGEVKLDYPKIEACPPNESLIIDAWDQS